MATIKEMDFPFAALKIDKNLKSQIKNHKSKMKPLLLISILLLLSPLSLMAQRFTVENFRADPGDISARQSPRTDVNGNQCAIIKVRSNINDLNFDSNIGITDVVLKNSEHWLYVSPLERNIKFMKDGFISLDYNLPLRIEASGVYILELLATDVPAKTLPVTIRLTPADATLYLNGKLVNNTAPHQLAPGANTIRIEKTDFQTIEKTITISEQQVFFEFKLERQPDAGLQIETIPADAAIYLDGIALGTSPIAVFYKPGTYPIRIVKEGYVTIENAMLDVKLPNTRKSYTLEENVGYITINTHNGAAVFINDQRISNPKNVKLSPQLLRIKVSMPKTKDLEQQIVLRRNDRLTLDMYPDVQTASIQIAVTPFNAIIELTGDAGERYTAEGMKIFENIPIGTYTIKVTAQGHETKQESLTLKTGERQSKSIRLSETQIAKPTAEQTASNTAANMNFGTVYNPKTGKTWMDRNLGANRVAQSSTDSEAYGDLYQWGRGTDGHEKRTSGTTSTLSSSNNPGHGNFILAPNSPHDWRNPQNPNLWQGVNGTNNPCPPGFRLPTEAEWEAERQSWSNNNAADAFKSPLRLPVAGNRNGSNGSLGLVGSYGSYWSATVDGTNARRLYFYSSNALMDSDNRAYGRSVRCLKD